MANTCKDKEIMMKKTILTIITGVIIAMAWLLLGQETRFDDQDYELQANNSYSREKGAQDIDKESFVNSMNQNPAPQKVDEYNKSVYLEAIGYLITYNKDETLRKNLMDYAYNYDHEHGTTLMRHRDKPDDEYPEGREVWNDEVLKGIVNANRDSYEKEWLSHFPKDLYKRE